jgi:hypothetical protein
MMGHFSSVLCLQLTILVCVQLHFGLPFSIKIHNPDLLWDRKVGGLLAHFDFTDHPLIKTASDVSLLTSFALAVNGSVCEKFTGRLDEIEFVVTANCLPFESYWFSIMAFTEGDNVLSSNGIFIPSLAALMEVTEDQQQQRQLPQHQYLQQQQQQLRRLPQHDEQITLVLPLTFNDVSRSFILLDSLSLLEGALIRELLIYAPPSEVTAVQQLLLGVTLGLTFPVTIASERELLSPHHIQTEGAYPYAVQMALKLLVSAHVSTPFYLTLDADVVLLRAFGYSDVIDHRGRALYHHEPRHLVHPLWWEGSEQFLHLRGEGGGGERERAQQGFGVTPALLSTHGARLTVDLVAQHSVAAQYERPLEAWIRLLGHRGTVWSEYTLYAVTLHHYQVRHYCTALHCNVLS